MKRITTFAAALSLLALCGCAGSSATASNDTQPSTSVSNTSAAPSKTPKPQPAPIVPKTTLTAWYKANGSVISTLQSDVATVTADQHNNDNLSTDCLGLDNDWTVAKGLPPIPNAAAQNAWNSALQTLRQGWWDCNGGISDNKQPEISNAVTEIQSGGALLTQTKTLITRI